jgi:hypothetical protein
MPCVYGHSFHCSTLYAITKLINSLRTGNNGWHFLPQNAAGIADWNKLPLIKQEACSRLSPPNFFADSATLTSQNPRKSVELVAQLDFTSSEFEGLDVYEHRNLGSDRPPFDKPQNCPNLLSVDKQPTMIDICCSGCFFIDILPVNCLNREYSIM